MISAGWFVVMSCWISVYVPSTCYYGDGLKTEQDCQQYARRLLYEKNINVPSFKCVELFKEGPAP